jgi:hypothetical protein
MKIKICNQNGDGQNTKVFYVDEKLGKEIDISSAFYDCEIVVNVPAGGKVSAVLYAWNVDIDILTEEAKLIINEIERGAS